MKEKAFIGASLLGAMAASLCCILPIVFALAGAGIVGASAFFEAWRPVLLTVTAALLGLGFYFAYRKQKACAPGSTCENPAVNRAGRKWLWIATCFVFTLAAFPYYSGPVAAFLLSDHGDSQEGGAGEVKLMRASFTIEGMTCPACVKSVESGLLELRGVRKVSVSYEKSRADVEFDSSIVTIEQLQGAIQKAGYKTRSA